MQIRALSSLGGGGKGTWMSSHLGGGLRFTLFTPFCPQCSNGFLGGLLLNPNTANKDTRTPEKTTENRPPISVPLAMAPLRFSLTLLNQDVRGLSNLQAIETCWAHQKTGGRLGAPDGSSWRID